jgi:hypothetical protein
MNLETLRKQFVRIKIRHYNTSEYRATHVALVDDKGVVYIGISLVNPQDQFSRKRGIDIACGRALYESRVANGEIVDRGERKWSHAILCPDKETIDAVIEKEVYSGPYYLEEVVEHIVEKCGEESSCSGCCGSCHNN